MVVRKQTRVPARRKAIVFACTLAVQTAVLVPPVAARANSDVDAADCWGRFLAEMGHTEPAGPIIPVRFVGYTFRIPAAYLGRLPVPSRGGDDALNIQAWPLRLLPITEAQRSAPIERFPSWVSITIFGHTPFLHGQALLDAMNTNERYENRNDERDEIGFRVLRGTTLLTRTSSWGEVHISPDGPEHLFHCTVPDSPLVINPLCITKRWIGGPLRLEMRWRQIFQPEYLTMSASLERMMQCALDTAETSQRVWPALSTSAETPPSRRN